MVRRPAGDIFRMEVDGLDGVGWVCVMGELGGGEGSGCKVTDAQCQWMGQGSEKCLFSFSYEQQTM